MILNGPTACLCDQYLNQIWSPSLKKTWRRNGVDSKKGSEYDQGYAMTSVQGRTTWLELFILEKKGGFF